MQILNFFGEYFSKLDYYSEAGALAAFRRTAPKILYVKTIEFQKSLTRKKKRYSPTSARMTVKSGAAGKLTVTLNSNICRRSTAKKNKIKLKIGEK